ncbi:MAG: hypothetical protein ABI461_02135, partial [Polyangiaceae bacterium]
MDPFRSELTAAHEKIARLEEDIRRLQGEPPPTDAATSRSRALPPLILAMAVLFLFLVGLAVFWMRHRSPNEISGRAADYRGIATAMPPEAARPSADPRATPSSNANANAKPCNCAKGDPLCS